jgi:hypothetical protein
MAKKRKTRPIRYLVTFWRAVGEFKKGERRMMHVERWAPKRCEDWAHARKKTCVVYTQKHLIPFAHRARRTPKKIIELEVFPEGYSTE